jgi:hypothetical protein
MSRRATLPGAAELFRATTPAPSGPYQQPAPHPGVGAVPSAPVGGTAPEATGDSPAEPAAADRAGAAAGSASAPAGGSGAALNAAIPDQAVVIPGDIPGDSHGPDGPAVASVATSAAEPAAVSAHGSSATGRRAPLRSTRRIRAVDERAPSGRERHEEKITVYCSPQELVDLETARLQLRADHSLAVDRGRIVREAVAVVLADLEAKGENSILVRRLRQP